MLSVPPSLLLVITGGGNFYFPCVDLGSIRGRATILEKRGLCLKMKISFCKSTVLWFPEERGCRKLALKNVGCCLINIVMQLICSTKCQLIYPGLACGSITTNTSPYELIGEMFKKTIYPWKLSAMEFKETYMIDIYVLNLHTGKFTLPYRLFAK